MNASDTVTQVRYLDHSVQWLRMEPDAARKLPDVKCAISVTYARNVTDWTTRPPPHSPESRGGMPWPVQRDCKTGIASP